LVTWRSEIIASFEASVSVAPLVLSTDCIEPLSVVVTFRTDKSFLRRLGSRIDGLAGRIDGLVNRIDTLADRLDSRLDVLANRIDTHLERHAG
jgi:hypothetical protein